MTHHHSRTVIAIDGGGTHCKIALSHAGRTVSVKTGPANVSTDFDGAMNEITDGLANASNQAGMQADALAQASAFVGLAGMTGEDLRNRIAAALPFRHARIEDDRPAAVRGALGDADGVIAHCGTGSFLAAQQGGQMRFAGGWGPVLGDEASAHLIGRTALRMTLESTDGQHDPSAMSIHFLSHFEGTAGIVRFAATARPTDFGDLAPIVTNFAQNDDPLAVLVMQDGANQIATRLPKIGWHPGLPICLTGGIGPSFAVYLPQHMQADLIDQQDDPLAGALALANELALQSSE